MNNSARREFDDEEGVDLPEEQVDNWEKVTGPDHLGVILEEGWPILTMGGVGACQADVLLDRRPLASRRTHLPSTAGAGSGRCAARSPAGKPVAAGGIGLECEARGPTGATG